MASASGAAELSVTAANSQPESNNAKADTMAGEFTTPSTVTSIDVSQYDTQLQSKLGKLKERFSVFSIPDIEVHTSPPINYRARAEFAVYHDWNVAPGSDGSMYFVMFDTGSNVKPPLRIRVDSFPVASKLINELMTIVREGCLADEILRKKLFQVSLWAWTMDLLHQGV